MSEKHASSKSARYVERAETGIEARHAVDCARARGAKRCSPGCRLRYLADAGRGPDGRRHRKSFPTIAAARHWREDTRRAIESGQVGGMSPTLREAADDWLRRAERGQLRPSTGSPYKPSVLRDYRRALERHLLPEFGARRLHEITGQDVRRFAKRLAAQPAERGGGLLSASYVRNVLMPLRVVYREAIEGGTVTVNPTSGVRLPSPAQRTRHATPDEAHALLSALDGEERVLWATAIHTGMRAGELQALRWEVVDLASGRIEVVRSWDARSGQEVSPKSGAGRRVVPIPAVLRDVLVEHRLRGTQPYVFGRDGGRRPFNYTTVRGRARAAWKAAEIPPLEYDRKAQRGRMPEGAFGYLTFHECRHTFASLMIAAAVDQGVSAEFTMKELSEVMGHSSIEITMNLYSHLLPGAEDRMAERYDAYWQRANTAARIDALSEDR